MERPTQILSNNNDKLMLATVQGIATYLLEKNNDKTLLNSSFTYTIQRACDEATKR